MPYNNSLRFRFDKWADEIFCKKKLSFREKKFFMLVVVSKTSVFGAKENKFGITEAIVSITNDYLERFVERGHRWPLFL